MQDVFIGVDVGTTSARAGLFDSAGALIATARRPIETWREAGEVVEQSSDDIWRACAAAVREAMASGGVAAHRIAGVGFDATCSLVLLDGQAKPLSVSPSGEARRNVIVWMDHRAAAQARRINATGDDVLRYVGNVISPEMETPKILWLKENLPESYTQAGHFMDLADYLTFRATGSTARSVCTVTCKWTYLAHEGRWSEEYLSRIGLGDLADGGFARIGNEIVAPGTPLGGGFTAAAAAEFGLPAGTPVAAGLIDAHAGGVGTVGARAASGEPGDPRTRIAYIMGTSACIMASTAEPRFVPGVWGPYFSAMLPGLWLNEGGQSASGAAIDYLVEAHPAFSQARAAAREEGMSVLDFLEHRVMHKASPSQAAWLARDLHVLPEFLGNRSPFAQPEARAVIAGMGLDSDLESLERLFVAGLCGLAYGLGDVIDTLGRHDVTCDTIIISGGGARSPLTRQILADATGVAIALTDTAEPVLLGSAMLGAVAAGAHATLEAAMPAMSQLGSVTRPNPDLAAFHAAKRRVHAAMRSLDQSAREIMAGL